MRSNTATITAALAASHAQPSADISSQDLMIRLASLASTGRPAARSAAVLSQAGSIILATVSQDANPNTLAIYRIASPLSAPSWSAAAVTSWNDARAAAGCALVQDPGGLIRCFYVQSALMELAYRDSSDDGLTWSAETLIYRPSPPNVECTGLAAASATELYSTWYEYPQSANFIWQTLYSGGAWAAAVSTGPSSPVWGQVRGLAAAVDGVTTTRAFAAGVQMRAQQSGIAGAFTTYDGAATWLGFAHLHPMDTASNGLSFSYPSIHYDAPNSRHLATYTLQDSGAVSGTAASRTSIWYSPDGASWSPLVTIANPLYYEAHAVTIAGQLIAFDASSAFLAPAAAAASALDSDLLSIQIRERTDHPAQFTIILANQNGQWNAHPALRDNANVAIALGYNTSTIQTHIAFIDAIEYTATPQQQIVTLHCRDLLKFLDQVNPTLVTYTAQTVATIATDLCLRANVPLASLPGTSQFSQVIPSFTVLPGQTWLTALQRLGAVYDFQITASAGQIKLTERSAADPVSWAYGQEHLGAAWQYSADQPNVIRVVGATTTTTNLFAEAVDQASLLSSGVHRYRHIVDRLCDTTAKCRLKATLALRDDQTNSQLGTISVPLNPAHELLDVIAITDPNLNLSAQHARITTIHTHIDHQSGTFFQQLGLNLP